MDVIADFLRSLGLEPSLVFYEVVVLLIGFVILQLIRRNLRSMKHRGTNFIDKLRIFEAVRTRAQFKSVKKQKQSALEGYEQRFSIISRTIYIIYGLIWVLLIVIPFFGTISATVVSILAAILAAVIGIAARPFLENLIAGVVITFSRQFRTGDTVLIDKDYGTVEDITITHTVIKLWDWRRLIIPNSTMLNKEMVSYTTKDSYIWAYVEFWVAYETDMLLVEEIALDAANRSLHFAREGVPRFWIMEMAKEGIKCWVAAWTKSPTDAWYLKIDVRKKLISEFNKHGIRSHAYHMDGSDHASFSFKDQQQNNT